MCYKITQIINMKREEKNKNGKEKDCGGKNVNNRYKWGKEEETGRVAITGA